MWENGNNSMEMVRSKSRVTFEKFGKFSFWWAQEFFKSAIDMWKKSLWQWCMSAMITSWLPGVTLGINLGLLEWFRQTYAWQTDILLGLMGSYRIKKWWDELSLISFLSGREREAWLWRVRQDAVVDGRMMIADDNIYDATFKLYKYNFFNE